MAFPSYWQTIPDANKWLPLLNTDPNTGDWVELVDLDQPGGGGMWSRDDAAAQLDGHIPTDKKYDARLKMVGAVWMDPATRNLIRINPMPHPEERHLRVVSVDMRGYNPRTNNEGSEETPVYRPRKPSPNLPSETSFILLPYYADYYRQHCTLRFRPPPFAVVEEEFMGTGDERFPEWVRNCTIFEEVTPTLEVLNVEADPFLKWAEGPDAPQSIRSASPQLVQKAGLVLTWHFVDWEYLCGESGQLPVNLMRAMGHVNEEDDWLGAFPKGTLLFEGCQLRKYKQASVRTDPTQPTKIPYVCDVRMSFKFVDPDPAEGVSAIYRGHNLFPRSSSGKWYSAKRINGVPDPTPFFEFFPFDELFLPSVIP